jgi:hypothetical protein
MSLKAIILLLLILVCTRSHAQKRDCSTVKNGTFKVIGPDNSFTIIERQGDEQIETSIDNVYRTIFQVQWINSCCYTLKVKKVLKDNQNCPMAGDKTIVTVTINNVQKDGYILTCTSKDNPPAVFKCEKIKVKHPYTFPKE